MLTYHLTFSLPLFETKVFKRIWKRAKWQRIKPSNKLERSVLGWDMFVYMYQIYFLMAFLYKCFVEQPDKSKQVHAAVSNSAPASCQVWTLGDERVETVVLLCPTPRANREGSTNMAFVFVFVSTSRARMLISLYVLFYALSMHLKSPLSETTANCLMSPY